MGNYISVADVKGKAIERPSSRAGWSDTDIEQSITEAENFIEGKIIRLGYDRTQLQSAPLIKSLCVNYARYCVLRDIYTDIAPSQSAGEGYKKWYDDVSALIEKIEKNEVKLTDSSGAVILPIKGDSRYIIDVNTGNVIRAIRMAGSETWTLDTSYSDDDVIGKGGNE
jgi:hypothetical protein